MEFAAPIVESGRGLGLVETRWEREECTFSVAFASGVVPSLRQPAAASSSFHRGVELDFLLLYLVPHRSQTAATSLVHRNAVPSTKMRCMITASRRASATIAFLIPRCLAIFIAQALSQGDSAVARSHRESHHSDGIIDQSFRCSQTTVHAARSPL